MILGMNYSKRKNGNCRGVLELIESIDTAGEYSLINIPDLTINSCCDYNYACFKTGKCSMNDDFGAVLHMIREAEKIVVALPIYRGHLCSEYYRFHERMCGVYRLEDSKFVSDYLVKTTFVLFVNRGAGHDEAIAELKRDIEPYGGTSKIIAVASRDYGMSSIEDNLKSNNEFRSMIAEKFRLGYSKC